MRKVILSVLVVVLVFAASIASAAGVSGLRQHNHSSAAKGGSALAPASIATTGTISSTKACAANFARIGPNLCWETTAFNTTTLTKDACTTLTNPSGDAKALIVQADMLVQSANVAATVRFTRVDGYNDSGCATILTILQARAYEFTAVGAITIGGINGIIVIPSTTAPRIKLSDDVGNNGSGGYKIVGYFD